MKQINNLKIRHIRGEKPSFYEVVTPAGNIFAQFGTYGDACRCAKSVLSFLVKKEKKNETSI